MTKKNDLPVIGWLVNYSTTSHFNIKRDDLLSLMAKHNIPGNIAKKVIDKNAVIRSVRNTAKSILGKKLRFKVTDEADVMVMVIAKVDSNDVHDAKFRQVTKVVYNKDTAGIMVEGLYSDEIKTGYEKAKDGYESDQFRSIVLRYLKRECLAINYLETGNIYLVAKDRQKELSRIVDLFEEIGKDTCIFRRKEEYDTASNRTIMWDVAVGELMREIEGHKKDFENQDEVNERGLAARLRKYKATRVKAEMFESVLQGAAENLKKQLDGLTSAIKKKMTVE